MALVIAVDGYRERKEAEKTGKLHRECVDDNPTGQDRRGGDGAMNHQGDRNLSCDHVSVACSLGRWQRTLDGIKTRRPSSKCEKLA